MNITITFSTEPCALFIPGDTICDECPRLATIFIDVLDDEFCTALCTDHASSYSAFALDALNIEPED